MNIINWYTLNTIYYNRVNVKQRRQCVIHGKCPHHRWNSESYHTKCLPTMTSRTPLSWDIVPKKPSQESTSWLQRTFFRTRKIDDNTHASDYNAFLFSGWGLSYESYRTWLEKNLSWTGIYEKNLTRIKPVVRESRCIRCWLQDKVRAQWNLDTRIPVRHITQYSNRIQPKNST